MGAVVNQPGFPVPPPPGPLAVVDMSEPRAAAVMQQVRQRLATWSDQGVAMQRAIDAAETATRLLQSGAMASAMDATTGGACVVRRLPDDRPLWIVGDMRGDALALAATLAFIDEADGKDDRAFVAMLGDWTGGVAGDAACVAMVLERFAAAPDRTLLLRGDREWSHAGERAASGLRNMPCDASLEQRHASLRQRLQGVVDMLPAIALLPEGVVLAHGSLPRTNRLAQVDSLEALAANAGALRDCTLGRLHPRDARVQAGDRDGGVIMGVQDFRESLAAIGRITGCAANRLVRGQDAAPEGFRWFRAYGEGSVLTITTMADALPEAAGGGRRRPCVARLKGGRIRVARLELPEELAFLGDQLFPRSQPIAAPMMAEPEPAAAAAEAEPPIAIPAWEPETDAMSMPQQAMQSQGMADMPPLGEIEPPVERPAVPKTEAIASGVAETRSQRTTRGPARDASEAEAEARRDPGGTRMLFDRGVRLLQARAWSGARDAFREAGRSEPLRTAAALNESVACLWLGNAGHQDALARLRELRALDPRDAAVNLNIGITLLAGERNPSEAMRALKVAVDVAPDMADAWWALGLAAAMRSDAAAAASAFSRAAEGGCTLAAPGSLHGLIPAREMAPALDALRGLARHRPTPEASPAPVHA